MKILAFAATNHKSSINKKLINYTLAAIQENIPNAEIELIDLIDYELPFYRQDREAEGIPAQARQLYDKIGQQDAIIVSFAEHNGSYTAVYKNLFDWMSRINPKVYQDKPMLVMAASPGPRGGAGVLAAVESGAPFFGMDIKARVSVPTFQDNFDSNNNEISNPEIKSQVNAAIKSLTI